MGSRRMDGLRALDVMSLLQERLAVLTGGRDRRGGPVLSFPATPRRERAKPDDYRRLLQYLLAIPWSRETRIATEVLREISPDISDLILHDSLDIGRLL
uniref:Uncharacterized protein n=1 Tax=Timema shepardi TaxID=629360 RepID=A0A7R9ANG3_TIMSH|nr:unnamed protein product [Timema shepardi]